jgi:hypothetical protein
MGVILAILLGVSTPNIPHTLEYTPYGEPSYHIGVWTIDGVPVGTSITEDSHIDPLPLPL